MKKGLMILTGWVLIIAALGGLGISIFGINRLWSAEQALKKNLDETLALLETTLAATQDGLAAADDSLEQAQTAVDTLVATINSTGETVEDTIPLLEALNQVTNEDLPTTITTTQQALESAQASARVIDSTLILITSIPFLPVEPYDTEQPLGEALEEVSASLDPLQSSLTAMSASLEAAQSNLTEIENSLGEIAGGIENLNTSIAEAQDVTVAYQVVLETLDRQVETSRKQLPDTLDRLAWFITAALGWLALAQLGLLMQGVEMLGVKIHD